MATEGQLDATVAELAAQIAKIEANVTSVVEGKQNVVRLALIALLAEGHLLLEDVPGVGKTLLAKAIGRSIDCTVRRVQFTPDLLPSDITGVTVYNQERGTFEFKPGAVFANIVLGDEINRAGPKTQSALLEAMEERTVSLDGVTHELDVPFMVIATQNPIELEGTYPLPEAQRDRFLMRLSIGYPSAEAELEVLDVPSRELARWESEQASQTCQKQPAPWWEPRPGDVSWRIVTSGDPDPETAARLFIAERGCHWASGTIVLDEGVRPTISTRDGQAVIALWAPAGQLRRLDRGDIDAITEVCGTSDWHLIDEHGRIVTTGRAR